MAILKTIHCSICNKTVQESRAANDYSNECYKCKIEKADKDERIWKASREGLSIEERIKDLEHFMYHHGTHYKPSVFG